MSDLIDRQAAIDALNNIEIPRNASWYQYYQQALTAVDKLPPAPTTEVATDNNVATKVGTNLAEVGTDCISREQAIEICDHAIDLLKGQFGAGALVAIKESIEELPPAQPEQLEQCPIYGGMCAYPSDQCYDCPRHAGAEREMKRL